MITLTDFTDLIDFMDFRPLNHIAIIPDGNRRWAKAHHLPSFMGHRAGAKTTENILTQAVELGIPYLTFWGASVSNVTKRDTKEVQFLFKLFTSYFTKIAKAKIIHKNEVQIQVFGLWPEYFPAETKAAIKNAVEKTKKYTKFHLTILLAYSGVEEMKQAVSEINSTLPPPLSHPRAGGQTSASSPQISEQTIKNHLYTKNLPAVDLVIRTGGEPHLSAGFMMWDIADAQLYFSQKMWPDFSEKEFTKALETYQKTERRLGR